MIPAVTSKLPTDLRTLFARKFSDRVWELNELLLLFKNELEAKERSYSSGGNYRENHDNKNRYSTSSLHSGNGFVSASCLFCGGNHSSYRCTKVTDPKIQKQYIFQKNLYFVCLSPKHKASNCKSNHVCKKCKRSS